MCKVKCIELMKEMAEIGRNAFSNEVGVMTQKRGGEGGQQRYSEGSERVKKLMYS